MTRTRTRPAVLATAAATAAVTALAVLPGGGAAAAPAPPTVVFEPVATGLAAPVQVTAVPSLPGRLLVAELPGRVRVVDAVTGAVAPTAYLDLSAEVLDGGERGLLGLLPAADFATSGRLYVTFTLDRPDPADPDFGALVVRRVTVADPAAAVADVVASEDLITVPHPGRSNHNGGSLAWDPGGRLLVGTGDGGGGGDPDDNARDTTSLLGKVLRLDVSAACAPLAYCIPADNPFVAGGGRPEIWLWGVRNPWRISVDAPTGSLFVADVGQNAWEEVTVVPAGTAGADLQWPCREGLATFDATRCPGADPRQLPPTTVLCHPAVPGCPAPDAATSVTGGVVYRGSRHAAVLDGTYVFGDFGTGGVWTLTGATRARVGTLDGVTSFGTDTAGEVWATTIGGTVARLDVTTAPAPPPGPAPPPAPPGPDPLPPPTSSGPTPPAVVVPTAPRGVTARRARAGSIVVGWRPGTADGYRVQARRPARDWRTVALRPAAATRWRWNDAPRTRLAVRVAAESDGVRGPWSRPVRVTRAGGPAG